MENTIFTPPKLAKTLGVDPANVIGWIRSGELIAFNVAKPSSQRPRWRITQEAFQAFMARRAAVAPTAPKPKRRSKTSVKQYI